MISIKRSGKENPHLIGLVSSTTLIAIIHKSVGYIENIDPIHSPTSMLVTQVVPTKTPDVHGYPFL